MEMSDEMQALCFLAGANSIFAGDRLLTTPNPGESHDQKLMNRLGMEFKERAEERAADGQGCCSEGCGEHA
jgi:biotin synthase